MLILAVLLALVLSWCTGGRLVRFVETPLYLLSLPILALLIQRGLSLLPARYYLPWAAVLLLISYGMLFLFLWRNRRLKRTTALAGLGSLCNLAVIAANGWQPCFSPLRDLAGSPPEPSPCTPWRTAPPG